MQHRVYFVGTGANLRYFRCYFERGVRALCAEDAAYARGDPDVQNRIAERCAALDVGEQHDVRAVRNFLRWLDDVTSGHDPLYILFVRNITPLTTWLSDHAHPRFLLVDRDPFFCDHLHHEHVYFCNYRLACASLLWALQPFVADQRTESLLARLSDYGYPAAPDGGWTFRPADSGSVVLVVLNSVDSLWNAGPDHCESWYQQSASAIRTVADHIGDASRVILVRHHPKLVSEQGRIMHERLKAFVAEFGCGGRRVSLSCDCAEAADVPLVTYVSRVNVHSAVLAGGGGSAGVQLAACGVPLFCFRDDVDKTIYGGVALTDPVLLARELDSDVLPHSARNLLLSRAASQCFSVEEIASGAAVLRRHFDALRTCIPAP